MNKTLLNFFSSIEYTLINQIKFIEEIDRLFLKPQIVSGILKLIAAFSISTGAVFLNPPYTKGFLGAIVFGVFADFLLLLILPFILGSLIDYFVQNKDRPGRVRLMVLFSDFSVLIYFLFFPISVIFAEFELLGVGAYILLLIILTILYLVNLSRGVKYIYELKERDSMRIVFFSFAIVSVIPFVFGIFFSSFVLSILG
ncbi:MAG: hypothetical protein L6Q54_11080 [Leptospiraceae bacterium]|nr:hypothetical protein [Leptospiraceae bacterium]MCK6381771.1 hypothetical protein [Leptospiraceae bacterium]NUM42788.1 hypothetical protein [Leptospiraceae bacterium]